jgi:hypothetical protein
MSEIKNDEKTKNIALSGVGVVATTATGVGVGLLGAAVGVAALAAVDIVLPALLCLKAAGVVGGGVGLLFGVNSTKKNK